MGEGQKRKGCKRGLAAAGGLMMGGVFLLAMLGLALELAGSGGGRAAREDERVERTAAQPTSTSRLRPARTPR